MLMFLKKLESVKMRMSFKYLKIIFRTFFRSKKVIILINFFNKVLKISSLYRKYILKVSLIHLLDIEGFCKAF